MCPPAYCPWPAVPAARLSSALPPLSVARGAAIRPLGFPSQSLDSCCSGTPRLSSSRSTASRCLQGHPGRKKTASPVFVFSVTQVQFSLEPEPVAINCTAFNHNGNLLVTGAADGFIRLFGNVLITMIGCYLLTCFEMIDSSGVSGLRKEKQLFIVFLMTNYCYISLALQLSRLTFQ